MISTGAASVRLVGGHDHADQHDHGDEHDHDELEDDVWPPTESVTLTSVGIDIGSATSHVIFSRLVLERQGRQLSSRYEVVSRDILWQSDVWLTPYVDASTIDADRLGELVRAAYAAAGVDRDDVDTGAVIITGEAARKDNAVAIIDALASHAGHFVCTTAGPVLEGVLAAHGSGALAASRVDGPVLNVDVGGGTTKLALTRAGHVEQVHAVNVGGRLIAWDADGVVTRVETAGARLAAAARVPVAVGDKMPPEGARRVASVGARIIVDAMSGGDHPHLAEGMDLTPPLAAHDVRSVMFSGGVGRMLMEQTESYGDIGGDLAAAILGHVDAASGWQTCASRETVRATCVGVSQFTVQLSGNTIFVSDNMVLPLRNLQVVTVRDLVLDSADGVAATVASRLELVELTANEGFVLSLRLPAPRSAGDVTALADGLAMVLADRVAAEDVLVIVVDQDIAHVLGHALSAETGGAARLMVIDQVDVGDLDFIDIGRVRADTGTVPIVVKSLVF